MTDDLAKRAWQTSVAAGDAPSLDEVRHTANKFYRRIKRRNAIEYVASALVIVVFTIYLFTYPHILHKIGAALVIAAAIYAPWQLHRRASAEPPELAASQPIHDFLRAQFVRQRDALKTVFWWYILPFAPGMALFIAGNGLDPAIEAAGPPHWVRWLALGFMVAVVALIWWLNQLASRKMQRRIDEIDRMRGEQG